MMPSDEVIDNERFRALPREIPPPPELEERIVAELRGRGLVRPPARRRRLGSPHLKWAATLAAMFVAGWLLGRGTAPHQAADPWNGKMPYLLLLYEPRPLSGGTYPELVAEYRGWARKMAQEGRLLHVERLGRLGRRVAPAGFENQPPGLLPERPVPFGAPYDGPTGYFLLLASDLAEAEALARQCPHIDHGGEIAVHPVDRSPVPGLDL